MGAPTLLIPPDIGIDIMDCRIVDADDKPLPRPVRRPRMLLLGLTLLSRVLIICRRRKGFVDVELKSRGEASRMLLLPPLLSEVVVAVLLGVVVAAVATGAAAVCCGMLLLLLLPPDPLLLRRKLCRGVSFLPEPMTDDMEILGLLLAANICCCFKLLLLLLLLFIVNSDDGTCGIAIGVGDIICICWFILNCAVVVLELVLALVLACPCIDGMDVAVAMPCCRCNCCCSCCFC